jgi:uncharacterized membrane protein
MPDLLVTTYEAYKAAHVLTAVIWVGGAFMIQVFAFRVLGSKDPDRLASFAADTAWVGTRVLVPTSFLLLVFGMLTASQGDLDFGALWIMLGLGVFLISFVTGAVFLGPESGRIAKLVAARGAADPEVAMRIRRVLVISRIELVLLLLIVIDMVVKPN